MTAADLARIAAAIAEDERTEAANWPLSRERARAYIELARAAHAERDAFWACERHATFSETLWDEWAAAGDRMGSALAALAPASDAGHSERSPLQDHPMLPVFSAAMDAGAAAGEAGT